MDMRKVIDVYAAATEHVDQGLSLTSFCAAIFRKRTLQWKTQSKQTTRDLSICAITPLILRHYIRTFTDNKGSNSAVLKLII